MTDETPAQRATAASVNNIGAELRRQAASLLAVADRIDPLTDLQVEGVSVERLPSPGAGLVVRERLRQMEDEGYEPAHDARHSGHELAWAAWCYLDRAAQDRLPQDDASVPHTWPWKRGEWKPKGSRVRNLVVAAALVVAEVDRLIARGEES